MITRKLSPKLHREFDQDLVSALKKLGYGPSGKDLNQLLAPLILADPASPSTADEGVNQLNQTELGAVSIFLARVYLDAITKGEDWSNDEPNYMTVLNLIDCAIKTLKPVSRRNSLVVMKLVQLEIKVNAFYSASA